MSLAEVAHAPQGSRESAPTAVRRPESVLIVIYTDSGDFLLVERCRPAGFWQSVTGSLEWGESPAAGARREVLEETGITAGVLKDLEWTQVYPISPAYGRGRVYPPGVTHNLEHAFALELPRQVPVVLSPEEHLRHCWVPAGEALELVASHTNRAVIEQLRR
jgi:dATP pyrophosphohydrolase